MGDRFGRGGIKAGEDRTAIELFIAGTRALALELHFNDTLRLMLGAERADLLT